MTWRKGLERYPVAFQSVGVFRGDQGCALEDSAAGEDRTAAGLVVRGADEEDLGEAKVTAFVQSEQQLDRAVAPAAFVGADGVADVSGVLGEESVIDVPADVDHSQDPRILIDEKPLVGFDAIFRHGGRVGLGFAASDPDCGILIISQRKSAIDVRGELQGLRAVRRDLVGVRHVRTDEILPAAG